MSLSRRFYIPFAIVCPTSLTWALAFAAPLPAQVPTAATPSTASTIATDAAVTADDSAPAAEQQPTAEDQATKQQEEAERLAKEAEEKAQAEQRKQQRQQRLSQLNFDRRRSTTLQAWAKPPGEDEDSEEDRTENAENKEEEQPEAEMTEEQLKAKRLAEEEKAFSESLEQWQRAVTLGDWEAVKSFLNDTLDDDDLRKTAYQQLLQSLVQGPQPQINQVRGNNPMIEFMEKNVFEINDVLGIAKAAPFDLERTHINLLGSLVAQAVQQGTVLQEAVAVLKQATEQEEVSKLSKRDAARMLITAGGALEIEPFLPDLATALKDEDHEALNLLSRLHLARHAEDKDPAELEKAWTVTQAILASKEIKKEEKDEALQRAVRYAPLVKEELGQKWLEESFTSRPERGMEIIASIGSAASQGMVQQAFSAETRLQSLQLQQTAAEALLKASPELGEKWSSKLNLLAENWRMEAEHSYKNDESSSLSPQMQRDAYGNLFYYDYYAMSRNQMRNQPAAIKTSELLEIRPSETWLNCVPVTSKPSFDMTLAKLYLKVAEETKAFPFIESLANSHPKLAKNLVDEFVRVWTQNHDPNTNRNRTNYYIYMYGYEQKAEGIPLTRSKQQRNLEELAEWVNRLKKLPVELDEQLIARAFSTCHSSAEVYRLDAIEQVFGPLDDIEPETLAEMAQQMRSNLMGVWRDPAAQQQAKTNRKKKDIEAEVVRGYEVARSVVDDALQKHPDSWALRLALASINHDENNYQAELKKSATFSTQRAASFDQFEDAAKAYIEAAKELREDEETTRPFEVWYYASLGACDLNAITEKQLPDPRQPARIRELLVSMPEAQAERHLAMFANTLFTRMSSVKPAAKYGYLKGGFEIVGDHKLAVEARKVFDYYKDLVTEIKLETSIDGSDVVGHETPFGVFVNIVHTREIERESGGFAKYLQNQNNGMYYYNYGRPTENYRDKFEEMVGQALGERFEILSVTFQPETVNSRALPEYGWRMTPYAYLLLKARGPEVDKLPPLKLDLDFLDTSGYAVLPVESAVLPMDAKPAKGTMRPVEKLSVTQTLDERQAEEGKLILEVKASGQGLIPALDRLVALNPLEFDVAGIEDQGVSVSRFDPDADENVVVSERTWLVTLQAKEHLADHPKTFQFAEPVESIADQLQEVAYQRYVDADLAEVEPTIALEQQYGEPESPWGIRIAFIAAVAIGLLGLALVMRPKSVSATAERFTMPEDVTPFTVLGLLRDIQQNNGLDSAKHGKLSAEIGRIERYYFQEEENGASGEPDLRAIAKNWLRQT